FRRQMGSVCHQRRLLHPAGLPGGLKTIRMYSAGSRTDKWSRRPASLILPNTRSQRRTPMLDRRGFLVSSAAIGASSLLTASAWAVGEEGAIRPFRIDIPQERLVDLRRRIAATQWPDRETVADQSQGVPLATMQELARYWATDYDWRK